MPADRCQDCLGPPDHIHPPCGHCHGAGTCPISFCIICCKNDGEFFGAGTCMCCVGEGINHSRREPASPAEAFRPVATVDLHPKPTEVAVFSFPAGTTIRVHRPDGPREYTHDPLEGFPLAEQPYAGTVAGDPAHIGWGAGICTYLDPRVIAHNRHSRDRAVWQAAVKAVRNGGVVYVEHQQRDWHGKQVWVAVGLREGGPQ